MKRRPRPRRRPRRLTLNQVWESTLDALAFLALAIIILILTL